MTFLESWAVVFIAATGGAMQGHIGGLVGPGIGTVLYVVALMLLRHWGGTW